MSATEHSWLFGPLAAWWRALRGRQVDLAQLESSGEMAAIAHDAGLSTCDLRRLVMGRSGAADQHRPPHDA